MIEKKLKYHRLLFSFIFIIFTGFCFLFFHGIRPAYGRTECSNGNCDMGYSCWNGECYRNTNCYDSDGAKNKDNFGYVKIGQDWKGWGNSYDQIKRGDAGWKEDCCVYGKVHEWYCFTYPLDIINQQGPERIKDNRSKIVSECYGRDTIKNGVGCGQFLK